MPYTHAAPTPIADPAPSAATGNTLAAIPNAGGDPGDAGGNLAAAIALLAKTLATQKNLASSAPPPTKLREPDTFDGSDANQLWAFILQCSLHFQDRTNAFTTDTTKVTYALSYLTGSALSWFKPTLFDIIPPPWANNWDLFR